MELSDNIPLPIVQFLAYKETIQNRSSLTVLEYHNDLRTFFRYIKTKRSGDDISEIEKTDISGVNMDYVRSVTEDDIYNFMLYLSSKRENNSKTRARKLSAIKSFFKYHATKSKQLSENPAKDIDSPRIKQSMPKYLSLAEAMLLLESVDKKSPSHERDYAILTLFLNCGMRLSELCGINITDTDDELKSITVTGKGNKMRRIYLNDACRCSLTDYLKVRGKCVNAKTAGKDKNAMFLSRNGNRLTNKAVQYMVKRQLEMAGLGGKGYSTHKLRHTAATLMYNEGGVDVRVLKDILGHEQLNTTQIYTHVSDKKAAEAIDSNPLSKIKSK